MTGTYIVEAIFAAGTLILVYSCFADEMTVRQERRRRERWLRARSGRKS
jgi:hypothetical protein